MKSLKDKFESNTQNEFSQLKTNRDEAVLLLGSGEQDVTNIRNILGWNEDIIANEKLIGEAIDFEKVVDEHGMNLIKEQDLIVFCIRNNYVYDDLYKYKGPVSKELVLKLNEYCKSRDINLEHARNNLKVLAPFTTFNKKSVKQRLAKSFNEVALLEPVNNVKSKGEPVYKVFYSEGKRNRIWDFVKSLFLTHTKSMNSLLSFTILLSFSMATLLPLYWQNNINYIGDCIVLSTTISILLIIIFIIKQTVISISDSQTFPVALKMFNDEDFDRLKINFGNTGIIFNPDKWKLKQLYRKYVMERMYILRAILLIVFLSTYFYTRHQLIMSKFDLTTSNTIVVDSEKNGNGDIINMVILKKTSPNNYEKQTLK